MADDTATTDSVPVADDATATATGFGGASPTRAGDQSAPPVLVEGLTKRLRRGVLAVDGLDLTVRSGQIVGLAGPNGAGKSVTMKVLLGLVRPSSGRVEIFGEAARPGAAALARIGALVDGPGFVPHLSGLDNLRLAARMPGIRASAADIERSIAIAGLGNAIERPFTTYSHGMRYRLGLAQALLGEPDLLLLDEPTTGLDPAHVAEIRQVIAQAVQRGASVLLSSHQLAEIERVCTHVAVMREGRLLAAGSVAELRGEHDSLEDAYLDLVERRGGTADGRLPVTSPTGGSSPPGTLPPTGTSPPTGAAAR